MRNLSEHPVTIAQQRARDAWFDMIIADAQALLRDDERRAMAAQGRIRRLKCDQS